MYIYYFVFTLYLIYKVINRETAEITFKDLNKLHSSYPVIIAARRTFNHSHPGNNISAVKLPTSTILISKCQFVYIIKAKYHSLIDRYFIKTIQRMEFKFGIMISLISPFL